MFDESGNVLCVIDLDTVMPSFVFSDFGDFLRSGANTGLEDDKDLANVNFDIGNIQGIHKRLSDRPNLSCCRSEIENLPYAAALFPLYASACVSWPTISMAILIIKFNIRNITWCAKGSIQTA